MNDHRTAVVLALGSSLRGVFESSRHALGAALQALPALGAAPYRASRVWRSRAWPDPSDPPFLNGVVLVETRLEPLALLAALKDLEARLGRRAAARNAPRVVDLDLIAYGRLRLETAALSLPHPRASDRRFVMGPLAEAAPGWRDPVFGRSAETLAAEARVGADARPEDAALLDIAPGA